MFTRTRVEPVPEVGADAPEFNLPSAQGGQLRLSMRTVRGPVVVATYRPGDEEDAEFFKALAAKEEEINLAAGSVVGLGVAEPEEAREFVRATGIQSYVLYDYARSASRDWGLLERDRKSGDYTRPAVFVVGPDHKVAHAWTGERPKPEEILAKVSEITGLPKPAEEAEDEKPKRSKKATEGDTAEQAAEAPKMSAEERQRIKAERRAAREAGKSVKSGDAQEAPQAGAEGEAPKKLTAEDRARIKAERRAAREAGKSVKTGAAEPEAGPAAGPAAEAADGQAADGGEKPKKMSAEERERIKAERRAAREAGKSLKKSVQPSGEGSGDAATGATEPSDEGTREG